MSVATVAVAVRRRWRSAAPWSRPADAVVVVLRYVAKESGEVLQAGCRRSTPAWPSTRELGAVLWYFALGLLVAAVLVWLTSRSARLVPVAVVVAISAGGATLVWTYRVGESGARAVWGERSRTRRRR